MLLTHIPFSPSSNAKVFPHCATLPLIVFETPNPGITCFTEVEIINNFINGEFAEPHNKEYLDIYEPATGSVYGKVADSSSHDINRAVESAKDAFPYWSGLSMVERAHYLKKIAAEIKNRSNILAK